MIKQQLTHRHLQLIVTCVTAVCILIIGMRVPDLSRPQRPKQPHRAFIEKQVKTSQQEVKKLPELPAFPAKPYEPAPAVQYRPHHELVVKLAGVAPLFPKLSRASPVLFV